MAEEKFCGFKLIRPITWLRYHVKFHISLPLEAKWKEYCQLKARIPAFIFARWTVISVLKNKIISP
jgi:hypothetical protein